MRGKPEGRLDSALKAIEDGDLDQAISLTRQSVELGDPEELECDWLLQHLLEEPDAFQLWKALRYRESGNSYEAWSVVDRVLRERTASPRALPEPQWNPNVLEGKFRAVLSIPEAKDVPSVGALRGYFDILEEYPFNEVLTYYWKGLSPRMEEVVIPSEKPPRRSRGRGVGSPRSAPAPAAAAEPAPSPTPAAPAPSPSKAPSRRRSLEEPTFSAPPPGPVPAARAAVPAEPLKTVRRTPHMDVEPEGVVEGLFSVVVYADQFAPREGEEVDEIELQVPESLKKINVEVRLVPSSHFEVFGSAVQALRIRPDTPRSNDARFQMAARRDLKDFSGAFVSAYFRYEGRPCGRVRRAIAADALERSLKDVEVRESTARGGASPPARPPEKISTQPEGRAVLSTSLDAPLADIVVEVVTRGTKYVATTRSKLAPGYENGVEEDWFLNSESAAGIVQEYFEKFMTDANPARRRDYLIGAGKQLFRAAPKAFQKLMLSLDPKNPPKSFLVCTEEPYVPWELMVPNSRGKPSLDWPLPIGAVIPTGRWVSADYLPPVARLSVEASYLIAPTYAPPLDSSSEERILQERFSCESIRPAALKAIDEAFHRAPRGLIHFACHGSSTLDSRAQQITLEGEPLDSTLLEAQPGFKRAIEKAHPLVFLNACEVGRKKPGLVGSSGFAESFIALGAGAVIAPLWEVDDKLAGIAAHDFYKALADDPGLTFAEAVSRIRAKAYEAGHEEEDSFAAYTLYGDPVMARG